MKIKTLVRCESGDIVTKRADDKAAAEAAVRALEAKPFVVGARLLAVSGGQAIINVSTRFGRNEEHSVPKEVADSLISHGYAESA